MASPNTLMRKAEIMKLRAAGNAATPDDPSDSSRGARRRRAMAERKKK